MVHCGLDQFVLTRKLKIFDALLIPNATVAIFFAKFFSNLLLCTLYYSQVCV